MSSVKGGVSFLGTTVYGGSCFLVLLWMNGQDRSVGWDDGEG